MKQKLFFIGLLALMLLAGKGWGQQVIGSFPSQDGGFEGQATGSLSTTSSTSSWWLSASITGTINNSGGRSGPKFVTITMSGSSHRTLRGPAIESFAGSTSYVIQFFYKGDKNNDGTADYGDIRGGINGSNFQYGAYTTNANTGSNWVKYTAAVTPGSATSTGHSVVSIIEVIGKTADFDIDDVVIYQASAADISAPNAPGAVTVSNPTTNSLDVSWVAASGGVDGGGYVVVRYSSSPNADNDPNQNGIYAVGNTHTNGTGSLTGTIRYIGTGTSFTDNVGLLDGTQYWYKVYTVDKAFNYSSESEGTGTTTSSGNPDIEISSEHPASTNISQASTNNILASFQLDVTTASATLNGISVTTAGTYTAADIATNGFKFWINSNNNLTGATQLGSAQAAVGSGNAVAVSGLSQSISSGTTRYILLTADISLGATESNTIRIGTTSFANITFASGNKTGTDPVDASNDMTIIACTPTNVTGLGLTPGNAQIAVSWTNPACYDELMIVAKPTSTIGASPSGDGSAYTDNLVFGTGGATAFDGSGYVVYKGGTSPQIITGLNNGTTYYVRVFTRKGSVWSSGVESNATPNIANTTSSLYNGSSSAWLTVGNWPNGLPSSTIVAQFGTAANTTVGFNMNGATVEQRTVAGIELVSGASARIINNSSGTVSNNLILSGAVINGISNVIIRNNSSNLLTITDGSSRTLGFELNNSTNNIINIDGTGGIAVSCIISGSNQLTKSGIGTGVLTLSGANTYTGTTTVSAGTLQFNRTGGTTIPATNNVTVSGGTLRISSNQTLNNLAIEAGSDLIVDGGVTLTINGTMSVNESVTISGNLTIGASGNAGIAAGKALTVSGTLTNNAGTSGLVVASDATGTGSLINSTAGVAATVQRYVVSHGNIATDGWHLMGSPVATFNINGSSFDPGASDDLYSWDEATNTWLNHKAGNPTQIVPGTGYIVAYETTGAKNFSGNLNVADVSVSGLAHNATQGKGWHLLGNPFASALEWNKTGGSWALTNIAGTAKVWNSGSKAYVDVLANGIIPSAQGFFVQVNESTTGSLTIPAAARIHSSTAWYKNTTQRLIISASPIDGSSRQESQIRIESEATSNFDFYHDSRFLPGYAPQFYSISDGEMLSSNALPQVQNETSIPFGFTKNQHESFVIRLDENSLAETVFIEDLKLNLNHNLSQQPEYYFTSTEGDDPNRFLLHFGAVGVDEAIPATAVSAYVHDNTLYLLNASGKVQVDVLDISGRLVHSQSLQANGLSSTPLSLPAGVYVVRLNDGQTSRTNKVIVQ